MAFDFQHDTVILDASCLISLYATQQFAPILRAIPAFVTVAAYVYREEALWVYRPPDEENQREREPILLDPLISAGLLTIADIDSEEEAEAVVALSARIRGQGEAESGAIAIARNWALAVDDRKARRLVRDIGPHVQLVYSLDMVKNWADTTAITASEISAALKNMRQRGSYTPHAAHPLYQWWHEHGGG